MPLPIPLIYTGKNFAVPDWKSAFADMNASFRNAQVARENRRRYEQNRNDRITREFWNNIPQEEANFTNDQLESIQVSEYSKLEQELADLLKDNKGVPTVEDSAKARKLSRDYTQKMQRYNEAEKARLNDLKMIEKTGMLNYEPGTYEKLAKWDYEKDGVYSQDYMRDKLRTYTEEEIINNISPNLQNPDSFAVTASVAGHDVKTAGSYNQLYGSVDPVTGEYSVSPEQKERQKEHLFAEFTKPENTQNYISLREQFNKIDDTTEETYINKYGEGKAPVAWFLDKNESRFYQPSRRTTAKEAAPETEKALTIGGKKVKVYSPDNTYEVGGETYENVAVLPSSHRIGGQRRIRNASEEIDGSMTKARTQDYKSPEVVAITTDGKGNADNVVLKVRHDKFEEKNGEPVYSLFGRYKGTRKEIEQAYKADTDREMTDGLWNQAQPVRSTGEFKTIVAPARDNKWVFDEVRFTGYKGVTEAPREEPRKKGAAEVTVLSEEVDTGTLETGKVYIYNNEEYTWNGTNLIKNER